MSDHAMIVHEESRFLSPAATMSQALERYALMSKFIEKVMRTDVDYGAIPGTTKPTLLKPGAEKLCSLFGLAPRFLVTDKALDWTGEDHAGEPFFYFEYKCQLYTGDRLVGEGEGSCNSFEKKYRYRTAELKCPQCGKETIKRSKYPPRNNPNAEPGWYCFGKIGGCGANFDANAPAIVEQDRGTVKNPDPSDQVNTIQKMAQKRSLIAAVLVATNASEYFTQDMEDFADAITAEYHEVMEPDPVPGVPEPVAESPAQPKNGKPTPIATATVKIGKNVYPVTWGKAIADAGLYQQAKNFEIDGILVKLAMPDDTPADIAAGAVQAYLNGKADGDDPMVAAKAFIAAV